MTGRGRGRGHRMTSVDRDGLPSSNQQPTPVFPVMEQKPLPLTGGEEAEYLLALKQEFRGVMKSLASFVQPAAAHKDVERYSDKYHSGEQSDGLTDWTPDWRRLPKELRVHVRKPSACCASAAPGRHDNARSAQKKRVTEKQEVLLTLETLEKKEEERGSSGEEEEGGDEKKKKQEEEDVEGEEERDEEEFEEGTDYIMSYFDNGEDFGGESDDNVDEAVY
ncbi:DNA-directed RNA polymerase III subunit RPC7-like isoform X2 [Brachionichthys hirsutus]|uniref:DNA-directed RNA polymerase III subunit RPC7-like isoform X2 n=1 Tax=Brachionichthys hirsutus TaxID=412623 RepID=UPI003605185A